jgi:Fe-S-cluster containining protein
VKLQVPSEQRFTCAQCGACCRGGWAIVVTAAEVERYRSIGAARWYADADAPGADPFLPAPGGHFRIRPRADGACGFLTDANRCRIHEELGAQAKPLACRTFPFAFHPARGRPLVTASASCPTIVRDEGEPVLARAREIAALRAEWDRAFPEPERPLLLARGTPIEPATVATIRASLLAMLDREPDAPAAGVARWRAWLSDLTRSRVLRLAPTALAEYVALTGRHHATAAPLPAPATAPAVTRLLFRGFLFAVIAARDRASAAPPSRARHLRHLAHLHGLAPATGSVDRRALHAARLDLRDRETRRLLRHALVSIADGLGTGRRAVADEIAVGAMTLASACALAAMEARREGKDGVDAPRLARGLSGAAILGHADAGALAALATTLAGGIDALRLVEDALRAAGQGAGVAAER